MIYNLAVKILLFFGAKVKVDSQSVRREMNGYFHFNDWQYQTSITDVEVFQKRDKLIITITTHRPGLLIGKAGTFINGLNDWLKKELKVDIEIHIKESLLWHNLYK